MRRGTGVVGLTPCADNTDAATRWLVKPVEYCESCIVTEDTPYHVEGGDLKGTHSDTGILHLGRVVWIRKNPERQGPEQQVSVYAEGVGLVSVEARFLRPSS